MRLFTKRKDGGPASTVTGWWLVEIKRLVSIVLLRFSDGSRDAYHSHAFGSLNWVLRGRVTEYTLDGETRGYAPSWRPIRTPRSRFHKVVSVGNTWVLSLRGPWAHSWEEYIPGRGRVTLTHGRKEIT